MKEKLNEKFSADFEQQKKNIEWNNKEAKLNDFKNEFNEILSQNPINIYTQYNKDMKARKENLFFKGVESLRSDESGTGGNVGFELTIKGGKVYDWIYVNKDGSVSADHYLRKDDCYKITNDSFQNILTMVNKLIKNSGYNDKEKNAMFNGIVEHFKGKIIKDEDLK